MARFDVYAHPDPAEREFIPFLLSVQNSYLDLIDTTVVIPLSEPGTVSLLVPNLNPRLTVQGQDYILNTAALGPVPNGALRSPVAHLGDQQLTIQTALDTLFGGY
jgi:toxin CcdB